MRHHRMDEACFEVPVPPGPDSHPTPSAHRPGLLIAAMTLLGLLIGCSSRPVSYRHQFDLVDAEGTVIESQVVSSDYISLYYDPYVSDPRPGIAEAILSGIYRVIHTIIPDYGLGVFAYFGTVLDPDYRQQDAADDRRRHEDAQRDRGSDPSSESPSEAGQGAEQGDGGQGYENPG